MGNTESGASKTLRFCDPDAPSGRKKARPKTAEELHDPSKLGEDALREAALRYLDHKDASVEQVRRVLLRRVQRYAPANERPQYREPVERVLQRLCVVQLLDDERFARGLSESLRRRGGSTRMIQAKMRARGLSEEQVAGALEQEDDPRESELEGAVVYARKRRLRERYDLDDPKERQKALAALARQGFPFEIALRALEL